ncbi:MAG: hypothetical protein R2756_15915 [Bacteroidales bacterium]
MNTASGLHKVSPLPRVKVDISAWGPEKEDSGVLTVEDAIVSGPLLTDNGNDIVLDSINFNKNRHPGHCSA